jgi:hypothetical protein
MLFNSQSRYFPSAGRAGLLGGRDESPAPSELAALALILAAACLSRFYALDVPALLDVEGALLAVAQENFGHILRRSLSSDVHPPFFAFLYKMALPPAAGEFAARSLSAVAGVIGVFCLYRVGARLFSRQTGLVAASILCVDLMHVALSREARPLALVVLLATAAAYRLIRFLDRPSWTNAWLLVLACLLTAPWHISGVLPLAAIAVVLGAALFLGAGGGGAGVLALAGVLNCVALGLTPFLARLGEPVGTGSPGSASLAFTAARLFRHLQELLDPLGLPHAWLALGLLCAVGFFALWRERPRLCAALAALAGLPVLSVLALRMGTPDRPEYLAFLLPLIILFAARGVQAIPVSGAAVAVLVTLGGAYDVHSLKHASFYEADSGSVGHGRSPRGFGDAVQGPPDGALFAADPPGIYSLTARQFMREGLGDPRAAAIGADQPALGFYLIRHLPPGASPGTAFTGLEKAGNSKYLHKPLESGYLVEGFQVERTPAAAVTALPARMDLTADPAFFLSRVRSARGVTLAALPTGSAIIPSRFAQPGSFTFRVENATGQAIPLLEAVLDASALAPGDRIELSYSFDGASQKPGPAVVYGGQPSPAQSLGRDEPFATLDLTVTLFCAGERPGLDNIPDSARFASLRLTLDAPGQRAAAEAPEAAGESAPSN